MTTTSRGPSRRTLVKGAAWSVPVVAVAGAAPAMAASPPIDPWFQPGTFCKHPSDNAYHAVFCFNNTSDIAIEVTFTQMTVEGTNGTTTILPASVTVPAQTSNYCLYVDGTGFDSMPEATATLYFQYTYNGGLVQGSIDTSLDGNQQVTPCGTQPREDQPKDKPPHDPPMPNPELERARNAASTDVKVDEAPESTDVAESVETPAPVESTQAPAPAPAPGDDASATSAP